MKFFLKTILIILVLFSFNACRLWEDSPELQEKKQALALKKLQVKQEKELAELQMQTSLATIEKEKTIALQKMQNEIKEKELNANSEKELELIKQKLALQENDNTLALQMYLIAFLGLLLSISAFFLFYYLKRQREDELLAYNDNLKKYFYIKENESRLKIAEKILDTIAEGDLSAENEQKLINAFSRENATSQENELSLREDDFDNDAEIINEEISASQSTTASVNGIAYKKEENEIQ